MIIQEQIRLRAEQEYGCLPLMSMEEKQKESYAKLSYIEGAESMLPVMKDAIIQALKWANPELDKPENKDFDLNVGWFLENVYQPSESKS